VIAVMQPHRYTRLASLFDEFSACFNDADTVIVAPVYPAGEQPILGIDRDALVAGMRARGHRHVMPLDTPADLAALVRGQVRPGDYVVCLGAGSITQWAYALPGELAGEAWRPAFARHHRLAQIRDARIARPAARQPVARRTDLVSRRRAGAGAVHAGGRERSCLFPGASSARRSRHRDRARLQPDRARRRRRRRGDPARTRP